MILDAHHHLWRYSVEEYGWISAEMGVLARDYTVSDLRSVAAPSGVGGSIVVQARQTTEETADLLREFATGVFVKGVVGWAPLVDPSVVDVLDGWSEQPGLVGLRHVVQDEPDDNFLDRPDFNRGVTEVVRRGLTYDLLVFARQLPATLRFLDRHPDGRFVLDHVAKPSIKAGEIDDWGELIGEVAKRPNVVCKVSGMVTEADWSEWSVADLRPYLDSVLEAFGPKRLMFGSDWPVCLLASSYARWCEVLEEWTSGWSHDERDSFYSRTAMSAYSIPLEAS